MEATEIAKNAGYSFPWIGPNNRTDTGATPFIAGRRFRLAGSFVEYGFSTVRRPWRTKFFLLQVVFPA